MKMQSMFIALSISIIVLLYLIRGKKWSEFHRCISLRNSKIVTFQATGNAAKAQIILPKILQSLMNSSNINWKKADFKLIARQNTTEYSNNGKIDI